MTFVLCPAECVRVGRRESHVPTTRTRRDAKTLSATARTLRAEVDVAEAARPAAAADSSSGVRACTPNSFTAGTPVVVGDGSSRPISAVRVGDRVRTVDPATGRVSVEQVTDLIVGRGDKHLVHITVQAVGRSSAPKVAGTASTSLAGFRSGGGLWATVPDKATQASVTATAEHPFWVAGRGRWIDVGDVKAGDLFGGTGGAASMVAAVRPYVERTTVFNLTVTGPLRVGPVNGLLVKRAPSGEISDYGVYDDQGYIAKRVDLTGRSHAGKTLPRGLGVRPALPEEVP